MKHKNPPNIIATYDGINQISVNQVAIDEKSNIITAIPRRLRMIDIQKVIVTINTMRTQTNIVDKVFSGKGDCFLAVKGNQGNLYNDIVFYFSDVKILDKLTKTY